MNAKEPILTVPGAAADHLYREGSAKASFWEAVFGSSLSAKRRTQVSALPDGTRRFDVPLRDAEGALLQRAQAWLNSDAAGSAGRAAAALLSAGKVRAQLIGLQPRGNPVASFSLRFECADEAVHPSPETHDVLQRWFQAEGPAIARDILVPFGFTPSMKD